ncbi:MAG: glycosyltransferase family 2 protein [Clostridiales bacterium]|nr:glycosyltransferase family 2 protein [Clostridiales bacterium]
MVSIIIPTYKGEDNIKNAVESVLNQSYKDLEVIVVDDNGLGSEHQINTEKILSLFKNDNRFKYIAHEKNKNGSAARNTGIAASRGEYIGFLDDDDVFLREKTEKQVEMFSKLSPDYGMIYGAFREIINDSHFRIVKAENNDDFLFDFLCDKIIACSSTVLIRRSVLDKVKGWDESFKRHQDLEFFARVAFLYKTAYLPEICVEKKKLDRNTPEASVYEQYHMHYLNKMEFIVKSFDKNRQKKFYDHHYFEMGKMYIKEGKLKRALYWAKKCSNPLKIIFMYGVSGSSYVYRKIRNGVK